MAVPAFFKEIKVKDTSRAAKPTEADANLLRLLILEKITKSEMHGLTGSELADMLNRDILSIRPRLTELQPWKEGEKESPGKKRLGMTLDSHDRRKNAKDRRPPEPLRRSPRLW